AAHAAAGDEEIPAGIVVVAGHQRRDRNQPRHRISDEGAHQSDLLSEAGVDRAVALDGSADQRARADGFRTGFRSCAAQCEDSGGRFAGLLAIVDLGRTRAALYLWPPVGRGRKVTVLTDIPGCLNCATPFTG